MTGLVDSIVDSNGRTKAYEYDDYGDITSFAEEKNNNTRTVTYTYNKTYEKWIKDLNNKSFFDGYFFYVTLTDD